jgi:hypothetical protein
MRTFIQILAAALVFGISCSAHAQTWKPFCVDGGADQGTHNATWHKINTPTVGGGTWKPLGGCITPPVNNNPLQYWYMNEYYGAAGDFHPTGHGSPRRAPETDTTIIYLKYLGMHRWYRLLFSVPGNKIYYQLAPGEPWIYLKPLSSAHNDTINTCTLKCTD